MGNPQQLAPNEYKFNKIHSCLGATPNMIGLGNTLRQVWVTQLNMYTPKTCMII